MKTKKNPLPQWRRSLAVGVVVLAIAGFLYHVLVRQHLEQTAMLFVGLPCFIAFSLIISVRARTRLGSIMLWTTVGLLLSGPLLGEGLICILMAAPLFYGIALTVFGVTTIASKCADERKKNEMKCLLILPFVLLSLEGVTESLSFPREETITIERTLDIAPERIVANLSRAPQFPAPLPMFLQLGFPRPIEATGAGLAVGDTRRIRFAGGEGVPGDLVLEVSAVQPGAVSFIVREDTSHIAHWLDWREAHFEWTPHNDGTTKIRVTLCYDRRLDPAWYFGPIQRQSVALAGGYLLENLVALPPGSEAP